MTTAACFLNNGYPVMRLNLRGAGPSLGKCKHHYHAGRSEDLSDALVALPPKLKANGLFLIGVSLGGNVLLKFLGENRSYDHVIGAAAVSVPIDLKAAQRRIASHRNHVYHRYLVGRMKADAAQTAKLNGERVDLASIRTFHDFDGRIVAPRNGFNSADDYYEKCSALRFVSSIRVPTLIIQAQNDPWIPATDYLSHKWTKNAPVSLLMPEGGGHLGFHGKDSFVPWHNRVIEAFLARGFSASIGEVN